MTDSVLLRTLLPGPGTLVAEAIGLYQVAAGLGLALKFFLSAFAGSVLMLVAILAIV